MDPRIFDKTIILITKALDFRALRHQLIASNIANVDTPNYKAVDIEFEDELQRVLNCKDSISLQRTHPEHLPYFSELQTLTPKVITESSSSQRIDGNNVDLDKEMVKLSENNLMYDALIEALIKKFQLLKIAIKEVK